MFVQNPFTADFLGNWVLGDRQQSLEFRCLGNKGRGDEIVQAYGSAPFDLTGVDASGNSKKMLNITIALNTDLFKNWFTISLDLSPTGSEYALDAVTAGGLVSHLNSDMDFSAYFTASLASSSTVQIKQKKPATTMRFFINNGQAEEVLKFNLRAGVSEMPSYFMRHTVDGTYRFDFEDGQNMLVCLDMENNVDKDVVSNAVDAKGKNLGLDPDAPKADWQLMRGRSGIFNFQKVTVDESDRITEIIEYPAGAKAGDLARRVVYKYTDENKNPSKLWELPYTLTSEDLLADPDAP